MFICIGFLYLNLYFKMFALVLVPTIFILDLLDGYLAMKYKQMSDFGALYDIAVDRLIELAFLFSLADLGMLPIWIPFLILTRGLIVDCIRSYGVSRGFVGWGERSLIKSKYFSIIVNSLFFRALDGMKGFAFASFVVVMIFKEIIATYGYVEISFALNWAQALAWMFMVVFIISNLARAVPYLFELKKM